MRSVILPAPDNICLEAMAAVISDWLQNRCATTISAPLPIDWAATLNLNVFFMLSTGERLIGQRPNDAFGQQIRTESEKPKKPAKKRGSRVLTDDKVSKLEKDRRWDKAMHGPEQPAQDIRPPRPDSFRYQERERE